MIGFQNPFPVRMPLPIRLHGDVMKPETIAFDGEAICIRYEKNSSTCGWWDSATIHEIHWHRRLYTPEQILAHYAKQMSGSRRQTKQRLNSKARFTECGNGHRVKLTTTMAGLAVAGGADAIYLLSHEGRHGSLLVRSSKYQSYRLGSFRIGIEGQWPKLQVLTDQPMQVETAHGQCR